MPDDLSDLQFDDDLQLRISLLLVQSSVEKNTSVLSPCHRVGRRTLLYTAECSDDVS